LFAALVRDGDGGAILSYLHRAAPGLRGGAVAALGALGPAAADVLDLALADDAAPVRRLAVLVLRAWPPDLALSRLQRVLRHDEDANVCAAAAEVAAARGGPALAPALRGLAARFADHPFMRFCADVALSRLARWPVPPGAPRDVDLQKFSEFFYRHSGVRFADSQFYYLAAQLAAAAALHGQDSASYLAWLTAQAPAAELSALVRRFCPPRTLFFSPAAPPAPLAAVLPDLRADAAIWVMAQDAGQSVYALAMYAHAYRRGWTVAAPPRAADRTADEYDEHDEYDAYDESYERADLAALPPALAAQWFRESDGSPLGSGAAPAPDRPEIDLWGAPAASADAAVAAPVRLSPALRRTVWRCALDAVAPDTLALILCPQVLAAENPDARAALTARFYEVLRPGGFLCLGPGETLSRATARFDIVACEGGVLFQKPADGR
jgi:chemotaxis protein methyltransferase CheR